MGSLEAAAGRDGSGQNLVLLCVALTALSQGWRGGSLESPWDFFLKKGGEKVGQTRAFYVKSARLHFLSFFVAVLNPSPSQELTRSVFHACSPHFYRKSISQSLHFIILDLVFLHCLKSQASMSPPSALS